MKRVQPKRAKMLPYSYATACAPLLSFVSFNFRSQIMNKFSKLRQ